jgi:hypothetical protein
MTDETRVSQMYKSQDVSFEKINLKEAPCPVYIQTDIKQIIDLATIDTYTIGMYTYLKIEIN